MVIPGLEVCLRDPPRLLRGGRFGLLTNHAAVDRRFRPAFELLAERFGDRLAALFSPQHGFFGEQQDDMIETPHGFESRVQVPIHSLYHATRRPSPALLEGLDALVVDLPDVGCRVYTFAWTVSLCLEACAEAGLPVVILDRPNPLGGVAVEGACLDPRFATFVGRAPIPMRHGLTLGELTLVVNELLDLGAEVELVRAEGWRRHELPGETGLPWVPPSPNLPRHEGALVYPGQVLLEATNVSEGRGTTTPFELFGAPWVDPYALRRALDQQGPLAGLALRPVRFEPTFHKGRGRSCGGLFLHVTDPQAVQPYRTTLRILAALRRLWPDDFALRGPPYEYEEVLAPLACISGGAAVGDALAQDRLDEPAVLDALCEPGAAWEELARRHRQYA